MTEYKTIAIPDIHNKIQVADAIVARHLERPLRVIYLGDYFDDFKDSPGISGATAQWLAQHLGRHEDGLVREFLLGNHDLPYLYPELNRELYCSGYTCDKALVIASHLHHARYRAQMKLHTTVGSWLLTHAGLTRHWAEGIQCTDIAAADKALGSIKNDLDRGIYHPILGAGRDRGGELAYGGITWGDWSNFKSVESFSQLVGHTPALRPRFHKMPARPKNKRDIALDTHLRHYAIYQPETDSWDTIEL